ncbi:MAG: EscS/YscS/HrcS family type III secretion system export apparatus protein [Candidatus Puniceispirillum sp.]|nr:EscS/YscS/HrcS family type III secretion system export apparatus protein [Candidatus Pelagibacter sp.]MBA4283063.1 EscS/YscS/HrcS family type III secretion system export apparatus protein [Candidatus Puniceispirillum sp.]
MLPADVTDLLKESIFVVLKMSSPILLIALVVGSVISLLQTLVQLQEQTITFVPKLFAILFSVILLSNYLSSILFNFSLSLFDKIQQLSH